MVTATKLPEFHGKPLIEIPKDIPQADFLRGDFGKAVLEEYRGRVRADYENNKALNVLSYDNNQGVVVGSNPFAAALVDSIVAQAGLRAATEADLEKILKVKALELQGHYEDTGLVINSEDEPNSYLAKDLAKQIRARQKLKLPAMIPLSGIEVIIDKNSSYGLAFKLKDNAQIFYAPVLRKSGRFDSKNIDEKTGLPNRLGNGNRTLYIRENGLSRLYLGRGLDLGSNLDDLSYSSSGGQVAVVSGEAAKNLEK